MRAPACALFSTEAHYEEQQECKERFLLSRRYDYSEQKVVLIAAVEILLNYL